MLPTHELHIHLYGALTPEKLWELGKDRRFDEARINWYKQEYAKTYGRPSHIDEFWRADDGLELFAKEYVFTEKGSFSKFQASINLPIALFPLSTFEAPLLHQAASMHHEEGLEYVEYRVFLPPYFSEADQCAYLNLMSNECMLIERRYENTLSVRLVLSISRDDSQTSTLYATVHKWLKSNPQGARYVTGLDFCASECGHPPKNKKQLMERIHHNNRTDSANALAVLYHVGETFEHLTPPSALRWIMDAHLMGCHRLGHAVALGLNALPLKRKAFSESKEEYLDHLEWLLAHEATLLAYGHAIDRTSINQLKNLAEKSTNQTYDMVFDTTACEDFTSLQSAVRRWLSALSAIIETCPTSNLLISNLRDYHSVPAINFLRDDALRVCIGADDPGIFSTTLKKEFEHCSTAGIHAQRLTDVITAQKNSTAEILSGRKPIN